MQRGPRKAVRGTGFTRLADAAAPGLQRTAIRRGMAEHALIRDWANILGAETAALCRPVRVSHGRRDQGFGGTLVVAAAGPLVPEVTHMADRIVERVNRVYGYRAIARVRVQADHTAPLRDGFGGPCKPEDATTPMLAERGDGWHDDAPPALQPPSPEICAIDDSDLRAALARLETNIRRRPRRPAQD
jgi:hypothetical protein